MIRTSVFAAALVAGLAQAALAQGAKPGIDVSDAWARATPAGAQAGAAYVTVKNLGTTGDRLIAVSTPVAQEAQLHTTINDNGVMKMRPIAAIDLKPGGSITLKPGGMHMMLTGLKQPLTEGQSFPLSLTFEQAGKIETTVKVAKAGAASGMDMSGHAGMNMPGMGGMDMGGAQK